MAYLFVAIASVTHIDLFLNSPIKLPLLQIEIPLASFFVVCPALFILIHFGVMLHHAMLSQKAKALNRLLEADEAAFRVHPIRVEVNSYFFAQSEAGPIGTAVWGVLLRGIIFVTLNLIPLVLLLYFQCAYLPVHDPGVTDIHRLYIAIDIVLLITVEVTRRQHDIDNWRNLFSFPWPLTGSATLSLLIWPLIGFSSLFIATLPDLPTDRLMAELWPVRVPYDPYKTACEPIHGDRCAYILTAIIFERPIDYVSGRRPWLSRNLVITDKIVSVGQKKDAETATLSARGRNLRYATFDRSKLDRVDFTGASLFGASLRHADFRNAIFECAVRGKKLSQYQDSAGKVVSTSTDEDQCPDLSNAILTNTLFSHGVLKHSRLHGVTAISSDFRGDDFAGVDLSGANLANSDLRGAVFDKSNLNGTILYGVKAQGASFNDARMEAVDLSSSNLDGANFARADMAGATLSGASALGANFKGTLLFAAEMTELRVWQTIPPLEKAFTLADVRKIKLEKPGKEDLERITDGMQELSTLKAKSLQDVALLLDGAARAKWASSEDHMSWQLVAKNGKSLSSQEHVGHYLGDLGCQDRDVLDQLLRSRVLGGFFGGGYTGDDFPQVLPPGVTEKDVEAIRAPTYDTGWFYPTSIEYDRDPDFVRGLLERISIDCAALTKDRSVTLAAVQRALETAIAQQKKSERKVKPD